MTTCVQPPAVLAADLRAKCARRTIALSEPWDDDKERNLGQYCGSFFAFNRMRAPKCYEILRSKTVPSGMLSNVVLAGGGAIPKMLANVSISAGLHEKTPASPDFSSPFRLGRIVPDRAGSSLDPYQNLHSSERSLSSSYLLPSCRTASKRRGRCHLSVLGEILSLALRMTRCETPGK